MANVHGPARDVIRAGAAIDGRQAHERDVRRAVEVVAGQDVGRRRAGRRQREAQDPDGAGRRSFHRGAVLGKPMRWTTLYSVRWSGARSTTEMLLSPKPTT